MRIEQNVNRTKNPLVSVVMPMYKCESTLEQAIKSVLKQTYQFIELVIVNDQSPDNSYEIAKGYEKAYPDKIKVVNLPVNSGVSTARNMGMSVAQGDFITFLDSDDYIGSTYIEELVKPLRPYAKQGLAPFVITGSIHEWNHVYEKQLYDLHGDTTFEEATRCVGLFSSPWGKLFQTSLLRELHHTFDTSQRTGVEDVLFVMKYAILHSLLYQGRNEGSTASIIYNKQALLHYVWNPQGLTGTKNSYKDLARSFVDLFRFINDLKISQKLKDLYNFAVFNIFRFHILHWGMQKLIKFGGNIEEAMPYIKMAENECGQSIANEVYETYTRLKLGDKLAQPIRHCKIYIMHSLYEDQKRPYLSKLQKRLEKIAPEIDFEYEFCKYTKTKKVFEMGDRDFAHLPEIVEDMKRNGLTHAMILDTNDYIRSNYFKNVRFELSNKPEILIPRNRAVLNQSSTDIDIVNLNNYRLQSDLTMESKGAFIFIKNWEDEPVIRYTENDGYLMNGQPL